MFAEIVSLLLVANVIADRERDIGDISKEKCREYSDAVYSKQESPSLMPNSEPVRVSECRIVGVPLVVGGEEAQEGEFPHMAVIGYGGHPNDSLSWQCGGALISEQYVLTAAHCLFSREIGPAQRVKLGIINLDATENVQEVSVSERIAHPKYKIPLKYNDIGLLKLSHVVEFTPFVRPACLNTDGYILAHVGIATGFGRLRYDSINGSQFLKKVDLHIIPNNDCSQEYSSPIYSATLPRGITDEMLCAGELSGGKDTCQGDSGGPFQTVLAEPYCMYHLIGVTSFGKFCGFAHSPGVYTRVSHYLNWIENIVWR